jgi:nucleoside-diphosphate-sugar epimerase
MKVFVTGATGFIGFHLCHRLVAEGHSVVALVRDLGKTAGLPSTGVELLQGDLGRLEAADFVLPPCDLVVHLAGVVSAQRDGEYEATNFQAVKSLVRCLERQTWRPRRLLFASSLAAAGPSTSAHRKTESEPNAPIDPYGRAKADAEAMLGAAPFPTTSFRPAIVFGPRDTATLSFFKLAARGWGFRVAGRPQELSFIDIDDLVSGIVAMMADSSSEHRTYFVSALEDTDSRRLWEVLAEVVGLRVRVVAVPRFGLRLASLVSTALSKVFRFRNQLDGKQYAQLTAPAFLCSSDALQKAHPWVPRVGLSESLGKAWAGYRASGWV